MATGNYVPNLSLLGATSRIETPIISVQIGNYTFGVYQRQDVTVNDQGVYNATKIIYPNYVKSLKVEKINGQVNQYTLMLIYPIRPEDDPNFFEKVFSSVSKTRKIFFTYGDISMPNHIYRKEQALITNIQTSFDLHGSNISYTVSAVSSAKLGYSGNYPFPGGYRKPSDVIIEILTDPYYGLNEIFYGMKNMSLVESLGLIRRDDAAVPLQAKTNISVLEYLKYLVSCMVPDSALLQSNDQTAFYILTIHDEIIGETTSINDKTGDITTEILGGPYFKITKVENELEYTDAYELDIGFPTQNIVTAFSISDNENYSMYYNWQSEVNDNEYVVRIDDQGDWVQEFAPAISSGNDEYTTRIDDKVWWTKVTQYPISASVTLKGLLRPATLMQYVRLNVLFYGKKHISSGIYIVTKQTDFIDARGYRTTLDLTRIAGEKEEDYDS